MTTLQHISSASPNQVDPTAPASCIVGTAIRGNRKEQREKKKRKNDNVLDTGHALCLDEREDLLGDVLDGDDALELRLLAMAFLLVVREPRGPVLLYGRARSTRGPTSANTPSKPLRPGAGRCLSKSEDGHVVGQVWTPVVTYRD